MTTYLDKFTKSVYYRIRTFKVPWEVGVAGTSLVTYALTMTLVVIMVATSACAAVQVASEPVAPLPGQAEMVMFREVMQQVAATVTGNGRGFMMYNDKNSILFLAWPHVKGWAFVALDARMGNFLNAIRAAGSRGCYTNTNDFGSLVGAAQRIGYRVITPGELLKLAPGIASSVLQSAASTAASTLPNIMLIPVTPGMFQLPGAPVESVQ